MRPHYLLFFKTCLILLLGSISASAPAQQTGANAGTMPGISLFFAQPDMNQAGSPLNKFPVTDGSVAYGNNVWTNDFFYLDVDDPTTVNAVGKMTMQTASGDFHPDEAGYMYVIDINTNYLGKIDISSGATVDSVLVPVPVTDGIWTVLTIHKSTGDFYGVATNGSESNVYEIDPDDGTTTLAFNTGLSVVISGTFDGNGMIWLFEIVNDGIYKLDLPDMDLEFVGSAAFDGNFAQGMGYDPQDDAVYLAAYENAVGPQLRMLNKLTGEATYIADLPGETTAFGFPGASPLVSFITISDLYNDGSITNGDQVSVMGSYTNPETKILVDNYGDLFIDEPYPAQSYIKTRGLVPPDDAWNGGLVIAKGTVEFESNPNPYHPEDTVIAKLYVSEVQVLVDGSGPDNKTGPQDSGSQSGYSGTRDCDSCKFAILISGGVDSANNHSKYWENLVRLYNFKVDSLGYCENNVFVHYFKGDRRDNRIPQDRVSKADSAGIAASHTEVSKRVGACTRQGKESTFQKMVTNHGASDGTICLLGDQTLDPAHLKDMQQKIIDSCATTVYDEFVQCYGGYSVSEMATMNDREKATIYANSNADSVKGFSPHNQVHKYLEAKISALNEGKSYEEAVVEAKMAYDDYLPDVIDWYHQRLTELRNEDTSLYVDPAQAHMYFQQKIQKYTADSTVAANSICKSRSEKIVPFTEYCQWQRFVVPPGGQLVLKFEGQDNNCGNVTVYKEDPLTQQTIKVKEWNWNVEGSGGYQEGNNQRVINGDPFFTCTFWVHNDNNGNYVRLTGTARGNQDLAESPTNENTFAGFSFGGNNNSTSEFDTLEIPEYFVTDIDQIPYSLSELPGYFGPGYVQYFGFNFNVNPSDPYWQNMVLHLDVYEVIQPGSLSLVIEGSTQPIEVPLFDPGVYEIPIGDLSFYDFPAVQMIAENVIFSVDSWGLKSLFGQAGPAEHLIEIPAGWSGISSYVDPEVPLLTEMFGPLGEQFVLLQDFSGNLFWPNQGINTLQVWDPLQGYVVNMQQEAVLPVVGSQLQNPLIPLNEGWNYLPVPIPDPAPVEVVFAGIDELLLVKDIAGPGVFWPEYNINTLEYLLPGRAYAAFLQQSVSAGFDDLPQIGENESEPVLKGSLHTPWNPVSYAPNTHTVVFNLNENIPEEGDVIGAFTPDNWCAGEVAVTDADRNFALAVNGATPANPSAGFNAGEIISYKLYRAATHEVFNLVPNYNNRMNTGDFTSNGMSEITDLKLSPTGLTPLNAGDMKLYPNPTSGKFTVESILEKMEITVYSAFGKVVYHESGSGKTGIDLTGQSTGTYFVKILSENGSWFEKVVVY